jgi:hypothetical protein
MTLLGHYLQAGRRAGAAGTHITRLRLFGTRHTPATDASMAQSEHSANGIGPRSVWTGPARAADAGAPVLRRPNR